MDLSLNFGSLPVGMDPGHPRVHLCSPLIVQHTAYHIWHTYPYFSDTMFIDIQH